MGVLMLGAGLQGTLLGLRATLEGFPTPVTGIIMSCYYVGYLLGTSAAPRLIRLDAWTIWRHCALEQCLCRKLRRQ